MSFNARLAAELDRLATLLELTGENRFKVNAAAKAARVIDHHAEDLEPIAHDAEALCEIEGIGKGMASRIAEFQQEGRIEEVAELSAKVPEGLPVLLDIPGMGPKTVRAVWQDLNVESLEDLEGAIESGAILKMPRMGEKAVDKIKRGIEALRAGANQRLHRGVVLPVAEALVAVIAEAKGLKRAAYAGSLRRGRETVGDVDIIAATTNPKAAHEALATHPSVVEVIASGEAKTSVRAKVDVSAGRWKFVEPDVEPTAQVDLRTCDPGQWGAMLMYFTGSKEHNVRLRERAIGRGMTLNEYGLFPEANKADTPPQTRGVEPLEAATEEAIYAALELAYVPPEIREDHGEIAEADSASDSIGDDLVTVEGIQAELHAHTTESDGQMSLEQLVERAKGRGFHTVAVTDHSRSSAQAGGLDVDRLISQREAIERLREKVDGDIRVLCGSEVDILADGSLDFDDKTLAWLDLVVASPHTALDQDPKKATTRMLKAIENPFVHVIGHPTGRIINRRNGLDLNMGEIISAAVEHNVALEINSHWLRLDLRDSHVRAAVDAGCLIAIDCDVHAPDDFDNIVHGVATGRRGWLRAERCVNTWSRERLGEWIASKR